MPLPPIEKSSLPISLLRTSNRRARHGKPVSQCVGQEPSRLDQGLVSPQTRLVDIAEAEQRSGKIS
jgi:hypothetical protein